ncbi:Carbohydrate-binding CenC domain protein [Spirochaeta thermophila DSM 6578]|uniref:Carbohydrate-binding CenC domain protein n=1 Tax=Winmispira thermophila (strain ATCC 700085 / DSM 6578 / Z-1203) TaxID=869211 RepID=G0GAH8_WINT7|nr:carbohydrate binding domain-containing protein [Spirochaeta thermophila]AEJ61797.1 Carbohydrate-binding CenC domain protein [Spirochaeta thermophila DSM 6578]
MKRALSVLGIILGVLVILFLAGCEEAGAGGGGGGEETQGFVPHGGTYALKVETGDAGWKTAWYYDIENHVSADQTYHYAVWVYQETGSDQQFTLTLKSSDGSTEHYNSVFYQQTVPSGEWTLLEADFTLDSATLGNPTDLYLESATNPITFYFDDFVITQNDTEVVTWDFEDGTEQGWQGNNATVTVVTAE